jgi:hypothetical protein
MLSRGAFHLKNNDNVWIDDNIETYTCQYITGIVIPHLGKGSLSMDQFENNEREF